jgi:cohesin complex subunit SA-1/2
MEVEDEGLDDMDDQEDFEPGAKTKNTKKSPSPTKKKQPTKRAIQVQLGGSANKKATTTKTPKKGGRAVLTALTTLSKKVLDPSETPETSLVAALLAASKPIPGIPSSTSRTTTAHRPSTLYTHQLEGIARNLLQEHEPNSMHIQLLNLLFRSVGGSVETNLPATTDLEEMDDNEWDTLVTEVVQVMRETDTELLTANPDERTGPRQYRAIYQEFWYRLGVVLLSHTQEGGDESQEFSSNRFQVELVRELIARVTELVLVGQPDLRGGATIAIWELAKACMERTVELESKLATAQRQHAASKGQSRKLQALTHSMDSWKRHKAELEELVEGPVLQGVFIHRYRDSNPYIRCHSLEFLSQLTLLRPDLFLRDKYLKYFGWMSSDKVAVVRLAALNGLMAPFQHKPSKRTPTSLELDIYSMQSVCSKFLSRIVDCVEDSQSLQVQETAMELMLSMLQKEFLDDWDDDQGWDQVNLKALDPNTTPKVRKDALYFILEQLDCFDADEDNRSYVSTQTASDKKQVERVEGIASWYVCN